MDFHLTVTNYVGSLSTTVNGAFIIIIVISPPDNLGILRSQYYVGAFASFFLAATQLWTANLYYPNGTLFVLFSARGASTIGFILFNAALNLQFMMLSYNFAARYAAVRGGRLRHYLTNAKVFYIVQLSGVLGGCIAPILLLSPTAELRIISQTTFGEMYPVDFGSAYYFVCTYEYPLMGSVIMHSSTFIMVAVFQGSNLLIMLVCGMATYVHISSHSLSRRLREVNNRLLRARSFQASFSFLFLFMPGLLINTAMLCKALEVEK